MFDNELHTMILSEDGSYTAYSKEYDEHYHSTKDGALHESLTKHVLPAYEIKGASAEINVLDVCYGLGFNALATLFHYARNSPNAKLNVYSPELDENLVKSLKDFKYPDEFKEFEAVIEGISKDGFYKEKNFYVEVFLGDAREYVKKFDNQFDVVYQDAFSPKTNPTLWTKEYFADVKKAMKKDGILTTYSIALATRLALYENGFNVYLNRGENFRDSTVASLAKLEEFEEVDVAHKISCNPDARPLRD